MENLVQAPSHYVWEVAGKPIAIHLEFGVVDRVAMDVMRGFGAVPKRGAEVGGLLLGSFEQDGSTTIVKIEDYVPVTCDYLKGPSYQLTDKDEARFRDAVEAAKSSATQKIVGFFRSHTRDGLGLADEDLEIFDKYLGEPWQVMLLVRPYATRTSTGAFFFKEQGGFRRESSYQEFPFKRRDLGGGSPPPRSFAQDHSIVPASSESASGPDLRDWIKTKHPDRKYATAPEPEPAVAEGQTSKAIRKGWVWMPLSFVFLVVGIVVGFQAALMLNRPDATQTTAPAPLAMGLRAKLESGKIVVRWDRGSSPVLNAASGSLRIADGDFTKVVNLDARQLQNGSVIYMNADNKVGFRLEVTTTQKTVVAESTDYVPAGR